MRTILKSTSGVTASRDVRELDSQWLFERLAVRPPYFALARCHSGAPGSAFATIENVTTSDFEDTPIGVAEAGRHLAILGSCAVATLGASAGMHYVLAQRSVVRRGGAVRWASVSEGPLLASAYASIESRRRASAATRLYDCRGDLIFDLQIEYHLIAGETFERMNAAHRWHGSDQDGLHYERPEVEILDLGQNRVRARLSHIAPASCRGHFADFPMLPFDGLCGSIAEAARPLLERLSPGARWLFREARLQVDRMAFAGSTVEIDVRRCPAEPTRVTGVATQPDGSVVARTEAVWDRSPECPVESAGSEESRPVLRESRSSTALGALLPFGFGRRG